MTEFKCINKTSLSNREFVLKVVLQNSINEPFKYGGSHKLRADREIVLVAVQKDSNTNQVYKIRKHETK